MKRGIALAAVLLAAALACDAEGRTLFYPTVLDGAKNLLADARWAAPKLDSEKECVATEVKGGPFSSDENAWRVESFAPESAYWRTYPQVEKGHVYLVGAWVRYSNAKILFWNYGKNPVNGKNVDQRVYSFGGFNSYLSPYLSDRTKRNLGGDPDSWKLIWRFLEFPDGLADGRLCVAMGIYMATGAMTFASPFLVDVTGNADPSLTIDIRDAKPIRKLTIVHPELKDTIWTKEFATPVTEYRETVGGAVTDYRRGFDNNKVAGHALNVFYADGSSSVVFAPQENIFQGR